MRRRVAITGLGVLTPLGNAVQSTWEGLVAGRSGAGPITRFDPVQSPVKFACEVKGFDPAQFLDKKEIRRYDLFAQFAIDRKSTRLNSSHSQISYAVFCLKKTNKCRPRPHPPTT